MASMLSAIIVQSQFRFLERELEKRSELFSNLDPTGELLNRVRAVLTRHRSECENFFAAMTASNLTHLSSLENCDALLDNIEHCQPVNLLLRRLYFSNVPTSQPQFNALITHAPYLSQAFSLSQGRMAQQQNLPITQDQFDDGITLAKQLTAREAVAETARGLDANLIKLGTLKDDIPDALIGLAACYLKGLPIGLGLTNPRGEPVRDEVWAGEQLTQRPGLAAPARRA